MFQLFQLFQILSVSVPQFQILFLPSSFKKRISACSNPNQTKKLKEEEEFLSFPFQTIPESLETLDVSEAEKRSFLLGRKTPNLVRVRRAAVSVGFSVIEGEGRRVIVVIVVVFGQGKNARLHE